MTLFFDLMEQLDGRVQPLPRKRGEQLSEDFAADLFDEREGMLRAGVEDNDKRYKVKIWWNDKSYGWECSCGVQSDRVCEHVWGTVLTTQAEGVFDEDQAARGMSFSGVKQLLASSPYPKLDPAMKIVPVRKEKTPPWKQMLKSFGAAVRGPELDAPPGEIWPAGREVVYIIDREETLKGKGLVVDIAQREKKANGEWCKPKKVGISQSNVRLLPDERDRVVLAMLTGGQTSAYGYGDYYDSGRDSSSYRLSTPLAQAAVPLMAGTGRCFVDVGIGGQILLEPLAWGQDAAWEFKVEVRREDGEYVLEGFLARGEDRRGLDEPRMVTMGGFVFWKETVEPLADGGAFGWLSYLRGHKPLRVPVEGAGDLVRELHSGGQLPQIQLPEELRFEEVRPAMTPALVIRAAKPDRWGINDDRLRGDLTFDYADESLGRIAQETPGQPLVDAARKRIVLRDSKAETDAVARLHRLGFRQTYSYEERRELTTLAPSKLAKVVMALVKEGWKVEAEGKLYRQPGEFKIEVTSGIDWFELHGNVAFGDQIVALPKLLAALRRGEKMIKLDDGTLGMLPEEWLKKYGVLAGMGKENGEHIQFGRAQAGLLDALLAERPEATWDEAFEKTRQMLNRFDGVRAEEAPADFQGELRQYQKEGLGWMRFLREFSFGGCLADDMGLGKTVQVLGMMIGRSREAEGSGVGVQGSGGAKDGGGRIKDESAGNGKRVAKSEKVELKRHRPSLIVVPRSLVFNWTQESLKFSPKLRVLDHSHAARAREAEHFSDYDIVLTTYGTLRRDAAYLKDVEFDYVILDEAQAIKNPASETAKAARLLRARHRLALSGTPVQNHLGELWSLFEFLNPGMLGAASVFSGASSAGRGMDIDSRTLLSRAVRPFILRRTKEQVAKDLPAKMEQTIFCELDKDQRKQYDELKEFYRRKLLNDVETQGFANVKIQILEALLRLRQAACHPGLIDKTRCDESSAKLDTLLDRLEEIVGEGHKALVFSQFTSFLAIVKNALDKRKIKYEYLDGKTRDRQERVDKFQKSEKIKLFLISLKAGGVGLNLTSADYVFLLDPWWNPAVEAQAIDRTHRIGQTRQVFACRLIAKGTVEEKVLELQKTKRDLADAILGADNSLIGGLKREDLELLLS